MAIDGSSLLQRSLFANGHGHSYYAQTPGLPLSLKCMFNGRTLYRFERREVAVDDNGYLILNERQPYSIEIASPTAVETFVIWFPHGWAEEVATSFNKPAEQLLDNVPNQSKVLFFERYTPHDSLVTTKAHAVYAALKSKQAMEDSWLEEKLRDLLASMIATQRSLQHEIATVPALRLATREELWRRVNLARDYLHAHLQEPVSLRELATTACISPFHLLRTFKAAFGQTPHQYLSHCRIERAKFLLEKTAIPVTSICLECGFTSLGSFSALFHKVCGMPPAAWRKSHGRFPSQNSKIREAFLASAR